MEHYWRSKPRAVVMQATHFYEQPAFSANKRSLPIGPGATVIIRESQDIWYRVSMGKFESWVPKFVLREL